MFLKLPLLSNCLLVVMGVGGGGTLQLTITKKIAAMFILPECIAGIKQKRLKKDSKENT